MEGKWLMFSLLLSPVLLALLSFTLTSAKAVIRFCAVGTTLVAALCGFAVWALFSELVFFTDKSWFGLDALSAYHLVVMAIIFTLSSLYGMIYFREEILENKFTKKQAQRYSSLWFGSLCAMMIVLLSNNMVIMWVGIEATTLLTAFLICVHLSKESLEAMWKYLLMCSAGIAIAFMGTLFVAASTSHSGLEGADALLWTNLLSSSAKLNPSMLKIGFIFIVVGYGTKAGLAPMHNWLPDAHSQAPAPVSAVFSGFLLNSALYCILRYLPIVENTTGNVGWARGILVALGLLSILVAAVFIIFQHDVKRLLAYCSVEHIGIIALGVGLGGLGSFAALFHMLNHSLSKTISFFCAGRLGQIYGTHNMAQMTGVLQVSKVWGVGLIVSLLALIGMAPFAIFLSELMILKAAYDSQSFVTAAIFLFGLAIVFVGLLRHIMNLAWKPSSQLPESKRASIVLGVVVFGTLAIVLSLGLWMPTALTNILIKAANILGGNL